MNQKVYLNEEGLWSNMSLSKEAFSGLFTLDVRKELQIPKVTGYSRGGEVMIGGRPTFLLNILIVY